MESAFKTMNKYKYKSIHINKAFAANCLFLAEAVFASGSRNIFRTISKYHLQQTLQIWNEKKISKYKLVCFS